MSGGLARVFLCGDEALVFEVGKDVREGGLLCTCEELELWCGEWEG